MESVGQKLRESRLRLNMTLEQVSDTTRINLKNLTAIESDNLAAISSPFHYRSFVKQVASCVELDYMTIAEEVQAAASSMPEPLMPGQEDAPAIHVRRMRPKREWKLNWLRSVISFSLVMAACTGMYAAWQKSHSDFHVMVAEIGGQLNTLKTRFEPVPARAQSKAQIAAQTLKSAPVIAEAPPDSDFHIQLAAIEKTWLSIVADGKEIFNGVLDASETKVLEGHESARVRTGNAGGLSFTFNGKDLGILGPRGQVRTVIFTKDNYEVLPSTPQVALANFIPTAE